MNIPLEARAVVWDLDGTIINSFGIFTQLVTDIAPELELAEPSPEALICNYYGSLQDSISGVFNHKMSEVQLEDFMSRFLTAQETHYTDLEGHFFEDAVLLSGELAVKGLKQALVTNRDHARRGTASPIHIIDNSPLKDHIREIICGDDSEFRKPDPRVLGDLLTRWDFGPIEVLIIGDQLVDAQLAVNIGSRAIIVNRENAELKEITDLASDPQNQIDIVNGLSSIK